MIRKEGKEKEDNAMNDGKTNHLSED